MFIIRPQQYDWRVTRIGRSLRTTKDPYLFDRLFWRQNASLRHNPFISLLRGVLTIYRVCNSNTRSFIQMLICNYINIIVFNAFICTRAAVPNLF